MISLAYYKNSVTDEYFSDNEEETCNIILDDTERTLDELLEAFIKICQFAGYSAGSFDYLLDRFYKSCEDGNKESFKNWLCDCNIDAREPAF